MRHCVQRQWVCVKPHDAQHAGGSETATPPGPRDALLGPGLPEIVHQVSSARAFSWGEGLLLS